MMNDLRQLEEWSSPLGRTCSLSTVHAGYIRRIPKDVWAVNTQSPGSQVRQLISEGVGMRKVQIQALPHRYPMNHMDTCRHTDTCININILPDTQPHLQKNTHSQVFREKEKKCSEKCWMWGRNIYTPQLMFPWRVAHFYCNIQEIKVQNELIAFVISLMGEKWLIWLVSLEEE